MASEEKSFENVNGRTHGRMDDGRKVITIGHPEQSSGELKYEVEKRAITLIIIGRFYNKSNLTIFYDYITWV